MRESKTESVSRLAKLIELFHDLASTAPGREHEDGIVTKLQKLAAQFEFEIQTELARIGAQADLSDHEGGSDLTESVERICTAYQDALSGALTAHTRAVLNRQVQEIRKMRAEFVATARAA